jgi:hypothetical protein
MSQEILTGNPLSDGITYHASDINAAINNATVQPGLIENRALSYPESADKILLSRDATLQATNIQALGIAIRTNIQTAGLLNVHEGIALSGIIQATVSGTQNDFNPTNFVKSTMVTLVGTATITGMAAPSIVGTLKVLYSLTGSTITLKREDAGSSAVNRLFWGTGPTIVLEAGAVAVFMYWSINRWLLVATTHGL